MIKKSCFLRSILPFLCAAALFLTPVHAAETDVSFHDVPQDAWYASFVYYVQAQGLMSGTGAGTFSQPPHDPGHAAYGSLPGGGLSPGG